MKSLILPNFLIIGAQKAASTSIYCQLKKHNNVFLSENKEISYFNFDYNFRSGLKYYSTFFKEWNGEKAIGEATPEYLHDKKVPGRIFETISNVKLIVSLRDPIERAYSAYLMQLTKGSEPPGRSFEDAVLSNNEYLDNGRYYDHLRRYLKYFSVDQLLVVFYEDIKNEPQKVYDDICDFLEISRMARDQFVNMRFNTGGVPKSKSIQITLNLLYRMRNKTRGSYAAKIVNNRFVDTYSRKIRNRIATWNRSKGGYPKLSPEVRKRIIPLVRYENEKLADLIKRDLSAWNSY